MRVKSQKSKLKQRETIRVPERKGRRVPQRTQREFKG